eukprot:3260213-Rhodomonas_salina.8
MLLKNWCPLGCTGRGIADVERDHNKIKSEVALPSRILHTAKSARSGILRTACTRDGVAFL